MNDSLATDAEGHEPTRLITAKSGTDACPPDREKTLIIVLYTFSYTSSLLGTDLAFRLAKRTYVYKGMSMNAPATAKVLHLDDYRRPLMFRFEAPELEAGLAPSEKLFVQVVLSDARPELVGCTWSCRAARVSAAHLEFLCDQTIPPGALVDLWVDLAACPGKFFLSGRVHWSRPCKEGHTVTGIELEEGAATDFAAWVELHS